MLHQESHVVIHNQSVSPYRNVNSSPIITALFLFFTLIGSSQNILVSDQRGSCEPSIKIDPSDPSRMMVGVILDQGLSSTDGGLTWKHDKLMSSYGVWGDPVIDADADGRFYYFHLSNPPDGHWIDRIVCQRSEDMGETWTDGSFAGLNEEKQQDKHWSVIDQRTGHIYLTWTEFDTYGISSPTCFSRIRFSKSADQGTSWSDAITISETLGNCEDSDETTEGAVPAVGPDGELYVCWANAKGLAFTSSEDDGLTWSKEKIIDTMPGGWDMDVPGIYRCNGMPITKVDLSNGPDRGSIYITWADQRKGLQDTDIWIMSSRDGGSSWSKPMRVNNDVPGKHQFFPWMDVDQSNGDVHVVFYDRRNHEDNHTDVYLGRSTDGGRSFLNLPISESPFFPRRDVFFGDYTNISAVNGVVRPVWTRMDEGNLSVWTDLSEKRWSTEMVELKLQFDAPSTKVLCLEVKRPDGKIEKLFKKRFSIGYQTHVYLWEPEEELRGLYQFRLRRKKSVLWRHEQKW